MGKTGRADRPALPAVTSSLARYENFLFQLERIGQIKKNTFDWLLQPVTSKRSNLLVNDGMGTTWFWMGPKNANLPVNFTSHVCPYDGSWGVWLVAALCATHAVALNSSLLSSPASASTSNNIPAQGKNP